MRIEWVRFDRERYNPRALAAVRQGAREGTLLDVATDQIFIALLLRNLRESLTVEEDDLRLEFRPTSRFSDKPIRQPKQIRAVEAEQSNSTALVDNEYVVKIYRKLQAGINPEIEIGRFLTEVAGFANTPALLGSVELVEGDNKSKSAIAVVHAFVDNQGDAWTVTAAYLDRFVDEQRLLAASEHPGESEEQVPYLRYMSQTGRRVAEMHIALASSDELADFAPEPIRRDDVQRWIDDMMIRAERIFDALRQRRDSLREADRPLVDQLLATRHLAGPPERAAAARDRRPQHPPPRRLPSRPDADRQGRHLHHRLRRRAAPATCRAPAQGAGGARRRRPDPLDRLFRHRRAGARAEGGARRARQARHGACGMARAGGRGIPRRLSRNHDRSSGCGRPIRRPRDGCWISSCSRRRSTRSNTNWRTGRIGCAFR